LTAGSSCQTVDRRDHGHRTHRYRLHQLSAGLEDGAVILFPLARYLSNASFIVNSLESQCGWPLPFLQSESPISLSLSLSLFLFILNALMVIERGLVGRKKLVLLLTNADETECLMGFSFTAEAQCRTDIYDHFLRVSRRVICIFLYLCLRYYYYHYVYMYITFQLDFIYFNGRWHLALAS
jgi:hypothetical protein